MSNAKVPAAESDLRGGWFKLLIPEIETVFGGLFWGDQLKLDLLPFVYGKIDPTQVAFDVEMSVPFLALDRVVLVELVEGEKKESDEGKDEDAEIQVEEDAEAQTEGQAEIHFEIKVRPLKLAAIDLENRCYIPARYVACILPVDPRHPLVTTLIALTSDVIVPPAEEVGKILDIQGRTIDPSQLGG